MDGKDYREAMDAHADKLLKYGVKLHDFVEGMLDDGCSLGDVLGMLESEKMFRFHATVSRTLASEGMKALLEMLGGDEDGR